MSIGLQSRRGVKASMSAPHLRVVKDEPTGDERAVVEDACECLAALAATRERNDEIRRGALSLLVLLSLECGADLARQVGGLL
jgi:hypothetical protein